MGVSVVVLDVGVFCMEFNMGGGCFIIVDVKV